MNNKSKIVKDTTSIERKRERTTEEQSKQVKKNITIYETKQRVNRKHMKKLIKETPMISLLYFVQSQYY